MRKPVQTKVLDADEDADTLLSEIEEAMDSIASAMDNLRGYERFAEWFFCCFQSLRKTGSLLVTPNQNFLFRHRLQNGIYRYRGQYPRSGLHLR